MLYKIDGIIKFAASYKLRLLSAVDFVSLRGAHIYLKSESDDDLSALIDIESNDITDARELAEVELNRICNLLSFFQNIPISQSKIRGITYETVTSEGKHIRTGGGAVDIEGRLSIVKSLDEKSVKDLSSDLGQEYPLDFEEVIYLWREAISIENRILKYIFLYRVMEFLFESNTKRITAWIVNEEPSVQMLHDRQRGGFTIYTHLRDHIHPKQRTFPVKEITDNLPKLQNLVQQAIKERFPI